MASAMTINPYIHDDCGEREDACPRCLLERGWNQGHATATEAAEAARSQLAVAVEALEEIAARDCETPEFDAEDDKEWMCECCSTSVPLATRALAKLRAAKEGR